MLLIMKRRREDFDVGNKVMAVKKDWGKKWRLEYGNGSWFISTVLLYHLFSEFVRNRDEWGERGRWRYWQEVSCG